MSPTNRMVLTQQYVDEYFAHLNPLAMKITSDIMDTKLSYGSYWHNLNGNEQNEIINETLIRPELSLRYFYNVCNATATSSISAIERHDSATRPMRDDKKCNNNTTKRYSDDEDSESLTAIVLKDFCEKLSGDDRLTSTNDADKDSAHDNKAMAKQDKLITHVNEKLKLLRGGTQSNCAFDGRALRTYKLQEVALKVIYDDLGVYRDEHSQPFSYRTKSQINFQLFDIDTTTPTNESLARKFDDIRLMRNNYKANFAANNMHAQSKKLSNILHSADECRNSTAMIGYYEYDDNVALLTDRSSYTNHSDQNYTRQSATNNIICISGEMKQKTESSFEQVKNSIVSPDNSRKNSLSNNYKVSLIKTKVSPMNVEQCYSSGNALIDGPVHALKKDRSSYTISDPDEKYLSEETKLLDTEETTLKRGFDFLNNW